MAIEYGEVGESLHGNHLHVSAFQIFVKLVFLGFVQMLWVAIARVVMWRSSKLLVETTIFRLESHGCWVERVKTRSGQEKEEATQEN